MQQKETKLEKVIRQIKALLQLSEKQGDAGSIAEAESAAAKATQLMLEYNLEMHQLGGDKSDIDGVRAKINDRQNKTDGDFVLRMYSCIAQFNFCKVIHFTNKKDLGSVGIIGTKVNMEMVCYISDQLIERLKILEKQKWKQWEVFTDQKRNAFRRGYYQGAVDGIQYKLHLQREYEKQQQEIIAGERRLAQGFTEGSENSLILFSDKNSQLIQEFIDSQIGELDPARKKRILKAQDAKGLGYRDGKNMDINKGLEHTIKGSI